MIKKYYLIILVGISLTFSGVAYAQMPVGPWSGTWDGLQPGYFYMNFVSSLQSDVHSFEHSIIYTNGIYKKTSDTVPSFFQGYSSVGFSQRPTPASNSRSNFYDSSVMVGYGEGKGKKYKEQAMNAVVKDGFIFVSFPQQQSNKSLKDKWILIPFSEYGSAYDKLGKATGLPMLFDGGVIRTTSGSGWILDQSALAAMTVGNVFKFLPPGSIDDNVFVAGATRYDLEFSTTSLAAYYKHLDAHLTEVDKKKTELGIKGFKKALSDPEFLAEMSKNSYFSLWIDTKTQLPTRYLRVISFGGVKKFKENRRFVLDISMQQPSNSLYINAPNTGDIISLSEKEYTKMIKGLLRK